jgi:myo-inositol-1(or 4)-monophosphatase
MAFRLRRKRSEELVIVALETELLNVATKAAEEAGRRLVTLFGGAKLSVRQKHDHPGSIVTNADKESEKIILDWIKRSRMKCTVNSEEAGVLNFGSNKILWAVDPLDGTLNFAKRIPHFAVSIGVLLHNRPVASVIYDPIMNEMFTSSRDHGAYLNGKRIHVTDTRSLRDSALIFEWWNPEPSIPDPLGLEKILYRYTRSLRSPGSVALNLCAVASGRFDGLITVFRKSPVYEIAAGCLIVQEAGGRLTNSSGESWENFSGSVVAGGPRIQKQLLSLISGRQDPVRPLCS